MCPRDGLWAFTRKCQPASQRASQPAPASQPATQLASQPAQPQQAGPTWCLGLLGLTVLCIELCRHRWSMQKLHFLCALEASNAKSIVFFYHRSSGVATLAKKVVRARTLPELCVIFGLYKGDAQIFMGQFFSDKHFRGCNLFRHFRVAARRPQIYPKVKSESFCVTGWSGC